MRKTKIICTLGPAVESEEMLEALINEGMDVARLNFSHGSYEEQGRRIALVRKMRKKCHKPVAILLDTKGPEIRIGTFKKGKIELAADQIFTLTSKEVEGDQYKVSITYPLLYKDIDIGTTILIDDGLIEMTVVSIKDGDICCIVKNGGIISNHKGINIPGVHINMPYMSKKDQMDILFGIQHGVDFIAASFVRSEADVMLLRKFLKENGGEDINIIAKIENKEGVGNINKIIEASDGIMIARGDMGVELPGEEVPIIQKMIIRKASKAGKQVITATQMLDSMINNPRPTRAETTDVANAIYDGTSAIMLSGETAVGKFPIKTLKTMVKIAERTERDINYKERFFEYKKTANVDITDAIGHATCTTAYDLNSPAIVTVTKSGRAAKMISRYRPGCSIIGCTTSKRVSRQLSLSWGVIPLLIEEKDDVFELFDYALQASKEEGLVKTGDKIVITSGVPIGKSGTTNMMKVQVVL